MRQHPRPADRALASHWARELLAAQRVYILDTETTGLGPRDEIVQMGLVDLQGQVVLETLVRPSRPIPAGATAVHGITNADVVNAPSFRELYVQLSTLLAGAGLVAYNMDFDWRMLQQSGQLHGLPPPRTGKRHCAMVWYAQFYGQTSRQRGGYRWQKLASACSQQRIRVANAHSALGDCLMTLELIRTMAGEGE